MSSGAKKFFNVADLPYSHPRSTPSQPPHSFSPALRLIVPLSRFLVHGIPMDNPHILASAACQFHYNLAVQLVNERVSSQSTAPTHSNWGVSPLSQILLMYSATAIYNFLVQKHACYSTYMTHPSIVITNFVDFSLPIMWKYHYHICWVSRARTTCFSLIALRSGSAKELPSTVSPRQHLTSRTPLCPLNVQPMNAMLRWQSGVVSISSCTPKNTPQSMNVQFLTFTLLAAPPSSHW